jgi:CBS domain containing-hemolysin-like protein
VSTAAALWLGLLLLLGNAFFVGAEFALVSARRTQIEPRAQAGSRMARTTLRAMENVSVVMAGAQLGITVCSLGLGAVAEPALAHLIEPVAHALHLPDAWLHPVAFAIALACVVYLHVVLGEMVPKNLALAGPERAALAFGPPMMVVVTGLKPVVWVLNTMANVLLPLDQLETVERGARASDVEVICANTGYSRFPVVDDGDALVGYLHIKDVLQSDPHGRARVVEEKWVRPFANVRDTDTLVNALQTLQAQGAHMARVVDGSSTVLGVITLEDVIEELVGEIRDAAHADGH